MEIKVKDVAEDALKDLIESVGPERFSRFFSVDRWLTPTTRYTEEAYRSLKEKQLSELAAFIRPYKATVKVK